MGEQRSDTAVEEPAAAEERGYHHGDLANTLMDLALARIEAEGIAGLSLRGLAREAGVSATAPYRHFPSKRCLLAALATRGFRMLEQRVERAVDASLTADQSAAPIDPLSAEGLERRLLAAGHGYVQFAVDEPTTYHLMFGSVIDDFSEYESLKIAAEGAYRTMSVILEDLLRSGRGAGLTIHLLGGSIWSGIHGMASLLISTIGQPEHRPQLDMVRPGAPQAVLALREDLDSAMRALFLPLLDASGLER